MGSTEFRTNDMWVFDKESKQLLSKEITYVPALYKIFDEILVNAADNKQRDPTMSWIKVDIDAEKGLISVANNGKGESEIFSSSLFLANKIQLNTPQEFLLRCIPRRKCTFPN